MKSSNKYFLWIAFSIFLFIAGLSIILIQNYPLKNNLEVFTPNVFDPIKYEDTTANINELYIYGTHLNFKGTLNVEEQFDEAKIIAVNRFNEEIEIDANIKLKDNLIEFNLSELLNRGLYLDGVKVGNYSFFLRATKDNTNKYYALNNTTNYKKTTYYTITKDNTNNKITFENENNYYPTLSMNVEKNKDNNIYDITIDAGHGGKDPGACYYGKCETDYTFDLAVSLKEKLEEAGLKVKLTRENNYGTLQTYNEGGRVVIPQDYKTKFLFSFHLNSGIEGSYNNGWNGVEIYCPYNSDTKLGSDIATYITSYTGTNFSPKNPYKVGNGVYIRTFRQNEIDNFIEEMDEEGYPRYSITTNTNYYYLIRETGGYMTGAYTDGRDGKLKNPYVLSNVGVESYIMEIGYITSQKDVENIDNNKAKYIEAVKEAILNNIYK